MCHMTKWVRQIWRKPHQHIVIRPGHLYPKTNSNNPVTPSMVSLHIECTNMQICFVGDSALMSK